MTAVVFDFDGVIANSEPLHLGAFRDAFASRGWVLETAEYYGRYLGFGDVDLIAHYAADHELGPVIDTDALLRDKALAFRRRLASGPVLFPDAADCVGRLSAQFPLGIASGALRAEIEDVLSAHRLREFFHAIISIDDVVRGKPAPDPYLQAAAALGVAPAACVAIEDSPGGIASAVAAGLRVIAVTTSCQAPDLAGADLIVGTLAEVSVAEVSRLAGMPRV